MGDIRIIDGDNIHLGSNGQGACFNRCIQCKCLQYPITDALVLAVSTALLITASKPTGHDLGLLCSLRYFSEDTDARPECAHEDSHKPQ